MGASEILVNGGLVGERDIIKSKFAWERCDFCSYNIANIDNRKI